MLRRVRGATNLWLVFHGLVQLDVSAHKRGDEHEFLEYRDDRRVELVHDGRNLEFLHG